MVKLVYNTKIYYFQIEFSAKAVKNQTLVIVLMELMLSGGGSQSVSGCWSLTEKVTLLIKT